MVPNHLSVRSPYPSAHRPTNTFFLVYQFSTSWANAADDLRMTSWASKLIDYWHQDNQALDLASEFLYMGDIGEFQDPFPGFPLENVKRMRRIREVYDPEGVFSRLNWGGFKLGN
jgi:FAD/FMN-containing dehydrogenase